MFKKILVPLMRINTNVYAFLSGIWISLSTNIFTSLCFMPFDAKTQWHQYASTAFFLVAGAMSMVIAAKVVRFQDFNSKRNKGKDKGDEVIADATQNEKVKWYIYYLIMMLSILAGVAMLALNYAINPPVEIPVPPA